MKQRYVEMRSHQRPFVICAHFSMNIEFNNMKKKHTCMNLSIKRSFRHPWHSWSRRPRSGLRSRAKRAAHAPKYICPKLYTCRRPLSVFNPSVPIFRNNRRPWFSYSSLRDKVPEEGLHVEEGQEQQLGHIYPVDKEQQVGKGSAGLGKNMEKVIVSELILNWSCNKDFLIL